MHLLFIHKDFGFGFLLFVHEREVCLWMSLHMLTAVIPRHLCFLVVYHASTQLAWFTACSEIFWTYYMKSTPVFVQKEKFVYGCMVL